MVSVARSLRRIVAPVLDYALPPRCAGCGAIVAGDDRFCTDCWQGMRFLGEPCCARCGAPFEHEMGDAAECAVCMADPPMFDSARAVLAYGDVARMVALRLKYGRRTGLARLVAGQMLRHIPADGREDMLLVPVPLHRWRLWWRGFNQSALIARQLSRMTGIATDSEVLIRTRRTPPLRGLGAKERERMVGGAFSLDTARKAVLSGRAILLIDDIHTSGATANACARALRRGGAATVHLLCWARVLPED